MKHPKGKKENNVEESSVSRQKVENVETVNKKKNTKYLSHRCSVSNISYLSYSIGRYKMYLKILKTYNTILFHPIYLYDS